MTEADAKKAKHPLQRMIKAASAKDREAAAQALMDGDLKLYDEVFPGVKFSFAGESASFDAEILKTGDSTWATAALFAGPRRQQAEWRARHPLDKATGFLVGTYETKGKKFTPAQTKIIFDALPALTSVTYQNTSCNSLDILPARVKRLHLCSLDSVKWKQVAQLANIEHLIISNCEDLDPNLRGLGGLTNLKRLEIYDRFRGTPNPPLQSLEGIRALKQLQALFLTSAADISALVEFDALAELKLVGPKGKWNPEPKKVEMLSRADVEEFQAKIRRALGKQGALANKA